MLTNPLIPCDLYVEDPKSFLHTMGSMPSVFNSVLNVIAVVGAFNQEKALVGTLITNLRVDLRLQL